MKKLLFDACALWLVTGSVFALDAYATAEPVRFEAWDIYVDSGEHRLVAYQIEMRFDNDRVEVVGVEGGEAEVFKDAPRYDPRGLVGGRLILAAFTTDHENAPRGKTRVARGHLRIEGRDEPDLKIRLMTAAEPGGGRIDARVDVEASRHDGSDTEEKGGES
jgi:hypothetical protein